MLAKNVLLQKGITLLSLLRYDIEKYVAITCIDSRVRHLD